jgi:hypothetical protein
LFCYLPKPVELLYWFTGSWVYLPGLIGILLWLLLLEKDKVSNFQKISFVILPFLIAGTNELNLLIEAWLLLTSGIFIKPKRLFWFAVISFLLGAFLALLTPGNFHRSNFFLLEAHHPARDFAFSFYNSFKLSLHYLKDWFRSSPILLVWLCISFLLPNKNLKINSRMIGITLLSFLMVPLMFFPFIYGTGMVTPPDRLLNVLFIFIVLAGSVIFPLIINQYLTKNNMNIKLVGFIGIILLFQATFTSRLRTALFDFDEIYAYQKETRNRIELARSHSKASPNDTLVVPAIKHIPYTIFYADLSADANHWYNTGFAYYHKIKAVKVMKNQDSKIINENLKIVK